MRPADILDAIAPDEEAQALAWLWAAAADEHAAALVLDDLPRLVTAVCKEV
jgi:hypothetical protein